MRRLVPKRPCWADLVDASNDTFVPDSPPPAPNAADDSYIGPPAREVGEDDSVAERGGSRNPGSGTLVDSLRRTVSIQENGEGRNGCAASSPAAEVSMRRGPSDFTFLLAGGAAAADEAPPFLDDTAPMGVVESPLMAASSLNAASACRCGDSGGSSGSSCNVRCEGKNGGRVGSAVAAAAAACAEDVPTDFSFLLAKEVASPTPPPSTEAVMESTDDIATAPISATPQPRRRARKRAAAAAAAAAATEDSKRARADEVGACDSAGLTGLLGTNENQGVEQSVLASSPASSIRPREATEEDWQRRAQKRRNAVAITKASPEYNAFLEVRGRGMDRVVHRTCSDTTFVPPAPQTPDPEDRSVSKRRWEEDVRRWRAGLLYYWTGEDDTWAADKGGDAVVN
eukprot:TRINITY_DN41932_c0_g1_i1.p1 TRINITY_DN41932_c0_g1~~TRINITY_DN41932_c0_g1_i1.p1  ORF type:complete len:399 (+),score=79.17 TRINITY_DN41932_c0_g1_i1:99-1295(+)